MSLSSSWPRSRLTGYPRCWPARRLPSWCGVTGRCRWPATSPGPGASQPRFDDGFFPAFRAFCAAHLTDIIEVCRSRRYQMSEVARCTQIVLGIAAAAGGSADPVALVDLGTGAGFGLQLDRYRYRVGPARTARQRPG